MRAQCPLDLVSLSEEDVGVEPSLLQQVVGVSALAHREGVTESKYGSGQYSGYTCVWEEGPVHDCQCQNSY